MIDIIQLHEALRFSGFGPDVPFHSADSAHELKLRKVLDELGDAATLEDRTSDLETELSHAESDVRHLEDDLEKSEDQIRDLKAEVSNLREDLARIGRDSSKQEVQVSQ